jgi:hypothetical protein
MENYILPFLWMRGENEEIIRTEIEKIYECGIRALCVEARPHDDFCGPGWWHDMDIVLDEARKRNMKIWILDDKHFPTGYAAGLIEEKYPERRKWYLADTVADIFGGEHRCTLNIDRMLRPVIGYWQIGEPGNEPERSNNRMYAIVATRFEGQDRFYEDTIDLTDTYENGFAIFTLPPGQWRVHVLYKTRTDGGNEFYINMLDAVSAQTQIEGVYEAHYRHYGEEFGKTIAGFFSDEPEIGNTNDIHHNAKLGKKNMPLPWSEELEEMLQERFGKAFRSYLPFLYCDSKEQKIGPNLRYAFMDCVTKLYEKNFSSGIGTWCREHGVEYIGHVVEDEGTHSRLGHGTGHYFRAISGQDMAGVDVIGSQVVFGAPTQIRKNMGEQEQNGEFYHYMLCKMGASAGHLDPKKRGRTMCELFGAYGWNFGVRDMKYLLDHVLSRGINYLVPHAFSMADYPDIDCPPHFYARGNNGQFPFFAELMKYANRMCGLLNGGKHVASVAVLYDGEADWVGNHMPMEKIGRILTENQIEFDVVSLDMLREPESCKGSISDGKLVINGVEFEALLVPYMQYVTQEFLDFIKENDRLPVYFVGGKPEKILAKDGFNAPAEDDWQAQLEAISLNELESFLKGKGMYKISLVPECSSVAMYNYDKDAQIIMLFNENPYEAYRGRILLPGASGYVYYNGWNDCYEKADVVRENGKCEIEIALEPGESCVLVERTECSCKNVHKSFAQQLAQCDTVLDLSQGWEFSMTRAKDYPKFGDKKELQTLVPVSDQYPFFSGIMKYEKGISFKEKPKKAVFKAEHVYEVMRVYVNDVLAGNCLTPPYQIELTDHLSEGENRIVIEVANTPGRDQWNYPMPPFDFKHDPMEPSGMFGKVTLHIKK